MNTAETAATAVSESLVLGIDLGTSAVKMLASAADLQILATGSAAFATLSEVPGQAEQDPDDWLSAVRAAICALDAALSGRTPDWRRRIAAIGLAGQLPTLVCLGKTGVLGRAITWKDGRADDSTALLLDEPRRRVLYEQTGMPLDGRYLGPMFRHHRAARRTEVECILSAKDFLAYQLTGQRVTDPSTAAGYGAFDLSTGAFSTALQELWQLPANSLPAVRASHAAAGTLNSFGAELLGLQTGIPVTVGAADSVSSALAMGGLESGIACITMGSSTVIIDTVREPQLDPLMRYLLTPHVQDGVYGREMDLLATGTGYQWLSELLGLGDGMLDELAARSVPGARGVTFTPYLAGGEQGALWDPALKASVSGLTLQHSAADLARAFLEGVGFEIRRCLSVLAESVPVREIVVAGRINEHRTSLQMLADILCQPVQPYPDSSAAALGAAIGALRMVSPLPVPAVRRAWPAGVRPGADCDKYQRLYADYLQHTQG